jgi:hypothetical protein
MTRSKHGRGFPVPSRDAVGKSGAPQAGGHGVPHAPDAHIPAGTVGEVGNGIDSKPPSGWRASKWPGATGCCVATGVAAVRPLGIGAASGAGAAGLAAGARTVAGVASPAGRVRTDVPG